MSNDTSISVSINASISGLMAGLQQATAGVASASTAMMSSLAAVQEKAAMVGNAFKQLAIITAGGVLFKHIISDTLEWTSGSLKLSKALGITTEAASELQVALKLVGLSGEEFTGMAFKMLRSMKTNEEGMKKMGIATRDAHGDFKPLLEIMTTSANVLLEYKEGIDRDRAAMYLFGRGAQEAMAITKMNAEVMAKAKVIAEEYGLKVGPEGAANARKFKMAQAEVHLLFEAMSEKIGAVLLPILIKLAGWFSQTGPGAITVLGTALKSVISIFEVFGKIVGGIIVVLAAVVGAIMDVSEMMVKMWLAFQHFSMDEFKAAFTGGMNAIKAKGSAAMDTLNHTFAQGKANLVKLWGEELPELKVAEPTGKGNRRFNIDKPDKSSEMPAFEAELTQQKLAYAKQQEAAGTYYAFSKDQEADFWKGKLRILDTSDKDAQAISRKLFTDELASQLKFNTESLAAQKTRAKEKLDTMLAGIDAEEQEATQRKDLMKITESLLRQQSSFEVRRNAIKLAALEETMRIESLDPNNNPEIIEKLNEQKIQLETAHQKKMSEIKNKAALEDIKLNKSTYDSLTSGFDGVIKNFAKGTLTIKGLFVDLGKVILDTFIGIFANIAAKWLAQQVMQRVGAKITAASQIASMAAIAGAAGVASFAAAPWPIDVGAPAFGESMATTAAAYATVLPSARSGFDIPSGMNPITKLHEKEMVLPAEQADVIRDLAANGGGGGDTHLHVHAVDAQSVERLFRNNGAALAEALIKHRRNGGALR